MSDRFPVSDWQFWVATGLVALAAVWLLRDLLPTIRRARRRRRTEKRATITIGGKPLQKR